MSEKECVKYGSKLYCYDKYENVVYVYPEQKYDLDEVPKEVISKIIKRQFDVQIIIDEDSKNLTQDEINLLYDAIQKMGKKEGNGRG